MRLERSMSCKGAGLSLGSFGETDFKQESDRTKFAYQGDQC